MNRNDAAEALLQGLTYEMETSGWRWKREGPRDKIAVIIEPRGLPQLFDIL